MNATSSGRGALAAFLVVTTLFFAWGFITSLNDPVVSAVKGIFCLTDFRAQLAAFREGAGPDVDIMVVAVWRDLESVRAVVGADLTRTGAVLSDMAETVSIETFAGVTRG